MILTISTFYSHGDGVKDIAFSVEDLDGIMEKAKVGQNYCTFQDMFF
jgi:hypothetical protein